MCMNWTINKNKSNSTAAVYLCFLVEMFHLSQIEQHSSRKLYCKIEGYDWVCTGRNMVQPAVDTAQRSRFGCCSFSSESRDL